MKFALIAALVVAAVPVRAQEVMGQSVGQAQRNAIQAGKALNSNKARAKRVIGNISDVGSADLSALADFIRDNIEFEFVAQSEPSKLVGMTVKLNEKLADYPRVQIAYAFYEASQVYYASFPESLEKEYMRVSLATRGWMELGGEGRKLPVLEPLNGYKDEMLGGLMRAWYYGGIEDALANKYPVLTHVTDAKAKKQFEDFKKGESDWVMSNGFRFQQ